MIAATIYNDALWMLVGMFLGGGAMYVGIVGHENQKKLERENAIRTAERHARTSSLGYVPRTLYKGESR